MARVISVVSGKGGTGKTTITAAVSSCLAALGRSVLCIDTDAGLRNLDIALGMSEAAVMNFFDVIEKRVEFLDAAAPHPSIGGLYLLSAPMTTPVEDIPFEGMKSVIARAREHFDYCLIDAPAGLGRGFRLAAAYADEAVICSACCASSIRDADRTAAALDELGLETKHLVVNRVSKRILNSIYSTIDDVIDAIGVRLLGLIPEDPEVSVALNLGKPLVLHSGKSRYTQRGAARACLNIAKRLEGDKIPLMKLGS